MTQQEILQQIQQFIIQNGNQEITANILRPILEGMVGQANDKIGDLANLSTEDQTNVVSAINEVLESITEVGNVVIHQGVNNPNTTPPESFNITDYYWQSVEGSTVALWQYNELEWVKIAGQSIPVKSLFIPINDWTSDLEQQIADYINSVGLTVREELLYLYSLKQVQGETIKFQKYVWAWTLGKGVYGASNTIAKEDIFYISNTYNNTSSEIFDLGEIGAQPIDTIVNVSGPFTLTYGNANAFKVLRSGVESFYLYYGQEELIGAGEYQTNEDEYIEVNNSYPSDDLTEKLDRGGYTGTAKDLKDDIDEKANDSEVVKTVRINGVTYNRDANGLVDLGTIEGGGTSIDAIENTYAGVASMFSGQANQTDGYIQFVSDASGDSTVDSGYAYYEYLGTTSGSITDYRKLSEQESMDLDIQALQAEIDDHENRINTLETTPPGTPTEEQIIGTALEDLTASGTKVFDLNTFSSYKIHQTGNLIIDDSTTRPSSGKTVVKQYLITTENGTESTTFPVDWEQSGDLDPTVENLCMVTYVNWPTSGMEVKCLISQNNE